MRAVSGTTRTGRGAPRLGPLHTRWRAVICTRPPGRGWSTTAAISTNESGPELSAPAPPPGGRLGQWAASKASSTVFAIRPRSETSWPFCRAHARIAAVCSRSSGCGREPELTVIFCARRPPAAPDPPLLRPAAPPPLLSPPPRPPPPAAHPPPLAAARNKRPQRAARRGGVVIGQVNLIAPPVGGERARARRIRPVEVVDELHVHLLRHVYFR